MAYFSVDGVEWNIPCDIERISEMKSSNISGMLLNGNYFNDVLGQYLRYTVTLVVPRGQESQYTALYAMLTDPVAQHTFIFPYAQGTVSVVGRVEQISDFYAREASGFTWRKTKFEVISNTPYRQQSLSDAQGQVYSGETGGSGTGNDLLSPYGMYF